MTTGVRLDWSLYLDLIILLEIGFDNMMISDQISSLWIPDLFHQRQTNYLQALA